MKSAVIIPAFNEEQSIQLVISEVPKGLVDEIIVVNNNSTDKTKEAALQAGATVLFEPFKGYGAACLKGINYLKENPVDIVVFLDGDYSDYPSELGKLLHPIINDKADFVLGSRVLGNREKGALPIQSRFGSVIASFLIKFFWKENFTDLGPFRAIKFEKLLQLNMQDKWFGWTIEMQIKAVKQKLSILEIPVSYRKRIGKSKVTGTLYGSVMAGVIILKTIFTELFRNRN